MLELSATLNLYVHSGRFENNFQRLLSVAHCLKVSLHFYGHSRSHFKLTNSVSVFGSDQLQSCCSYTDRFTTTFLHCTILTGLAFFCSQNNCILSIIYPAKMCVKYFIPFLLASFANYTTSKGPTFFILLHLKRDA